VRGRWLILTQYYPPEVGAPQIRLRALARQLRAHGIEVEVLTAMPNYPSGRIFAGYERRWRVKERIDGVPVRRTWVYPGTGRSAGVRLANYLSFTVTALLAALAGRRPDILFVEAQPLSLGLVAVVMKWLRGVPYLYNVPDLQVEVARQLGFVRSDLFLRLADALERFFLRHSWKVSTVTHRFVERLHERGVPRDQITFLPNGADTTFLCPQAPCSELLDRWKLGGKKVFIYIGTHAHYHGLETLIEAARLLQERSEIAFLLIGDGPERVRIAQRVAEWGLVNVTLAQSPYEEMARCYSIAYASIAVLRRMDVARGMRLSKIFPALSCAVPIVYSGAGEAADLLLDRRCGLVVPPEDPHALADAIERLASDPGLRDGLGQAGRLLVEAEYNWSTIVARWLEALLVCEESRGGRSAAI
jgi:colanic acid biosynthesis glycosyl transferase WcaI